MKTLGELLSSQRKKKRLSFGRVARQLVIKKEHLEALEKEDWTNLPEPPFVKGFIANYAKFLGLDPQHTLALYRRSFDESKYPKVKQSVFENKKRFLVTPNVFIGLIFILATLAFVSYLTFQYFSLLSAPRLEIITPKDDLTTQVSFVVISGQTEKETTVSVNGEFVAVDYQGNFSYQLELEEGRNQIEIIASKRLSPKTKVTRTMRLTR